MDRKDINKQTSKQKQKLTQTSAHRKSGVKKFKKQKWMFLCVY